MNDQIEVLPAPLQEDSFDVVMRGYSRGQVDEFVKRTKRQLEELEARLARAEREAEDARRERDRASNEAAAASRKLESHEPSYEELGERLTSILQLGQEEAKERRANAEGEAQRIRSEAEEAAERIHGEVEGLRSSAEAEAEQVRSEATEEAERVRREAQEAAEQLRTEAYQQAQQLVSDAERRANQTEEASRQRVEQLEEQHAELVGELSTVRDSLQTLLPGRVAAAVSADGGKGSVGGGEPMTAEEEAGTAPGRVADASAAGPDDVDAVAAESSGAHVSTGEPEDADAAFYFEERAAAVADRDVEAGRADEQPPPPPVR